MKRVNPSPDAAAERGVWAIEKVVPGGDGLAHLEDGRVAFVTGAFPGDSLRPLAVEARKGHVRAARFELVRPSADRVAPPCPIASTCGGCDWMGLSRDAQLLHKEQLLRSALARNHVGPLPDRLPMTESRAALGYRARVRFHVDGDGRVGFFARGSHALVEMPGCIVCDPDLNDALARIRAVPAEALAAFSEIEVRRADLAPRLALLLLPRVRGGAGPSVKAVKAALPSDWAVVVRGEERSSDPTQLLELGEGVRLRAFPGVFTQVNWEVNRALVARVVGGARARGVRRFLDAYAGAGNFTLPLLASGMVGISIERDARAVECARRSAAELALSQDGFVAGDARGEIGRLVRQKERFDMVLLDPPRSGAKDVLGGVLRLAPRVIALCACDPVTLGRDLSTLVERGYRLDEVHGFDMFPSTHHLEALAWTTRSA